MESTAIHGIFLYGLRRQVVEMNSTPVHPTNPDPMLYVSDGNPNLPSTKIQGGWRKSVFLEKAHRDGEFETMLSQQWIVLVFSLWETEYRTRLASAHHCDRNLLQYSILGDLRQLRHDILHNRGLASKEHTGKCEIMSDWFELGQTISLTSDQIATIINEIPFTLMQTHPTP